MNSEKPKPIPRVSSRKYRGLGDVVHSLASPIAKSVDVVLGTEISTCSACSKRRKALNRAVPFR